MSNINWIDERKPDFVDSKSQILKDAIGKTRRLLEQLESGEEVDSISFNKVFSSFEIAFTSGRHQLNVSYKDKSAI